MTHSVFQQLHDSEINFCVCCFADCGFHVELGDDLNGIRAEARLPSWDDVEEWLAGMARIHFPTALFARVNDPPRNGQMSETPLQQAERHVRESDERITRQKRFMAEMGRDHPRHLALPRETLRHLQETHEMALVHPQRLRRKATQKG